MRSRPISISFPEDLVERIDALAERHRISRSEVLARFAAAGLASNDPVTEGELQRLRARRAGTTPRAPGLVVTLPPLAQRRPSEAPSAAEKSGGEDGNRRHDVRRDVTLRIVAA